MKLIVSISPKLVRDTQKIKRKPNITLKKAIGLGK